MSATFIPSAMGIAIGDELIFGIRVVSDGDREDLLGPRSRNPDRVIHGAIDVASGLVVSFEDFFDGGDRDYNDTIFQFVGRGGITTPVMFPSPLACAPGAWSRWPPPGASAPHLAASLLPSVLPRPTRSGWGRSAYDGSRRPSSFRQAAAGP